MSEWFENDEFWSSWYPYVFSKERFEQAEQEVDQFLALAGIQEGKVLDLACGPGRHAIELAKRGYKVTGVDRSPFLISKARERSRAADVEVEWVQQDMRSFERPDTFDFAINMFSAFGYFEDKSEDIQVLKRLNLNLVSGGVLVVDTVGKEWLAKHFDATSSSREEDGTLLVTRREIVEDWTQIRSEWILIRGEGVKSFESKINVYSGQELRSLLERVGFESVELYGDLQGNEYGIDVKRLIAVARK
jgi:SAM-dependent methyltransferase